jgi:hypothetical protein
MTPLPVNGAPFIVPRFSYVRLAGNAGHRGTIVTREASKFLHDLEN